MIRTIKVAILAACVSLCVLGVILLPKENARETLPETQIVPVNNQQSHHGIGLRV